MSDPFLKAYPFLASAFSVSLEIDGVSEGLFSECSGFSVEIETEPVVEGGLNDYVHQLPVRTKYSNITLKRGFIGTYRLWDWFAKARSGDIRPIDLSIILYKSVGQNPAVEQARWNVSNAYPVKWEAGDLRAGDTSVLVETLVLAHRGWAPA